MPQKGVVKRARTYTQHQTRPICHVGAFRVPSDLYTLLWANNSWAGREKLGRHSEAREGALIQRRSESNTMPWVNPLSRGGSRVAWPSCWDLRKLVEASIIGSRRECLVWGRATVTTARMIAAAKVEAYSVGRWARKRRIATPRRRRRPRKWA